MQDDRDVRGERAKKKLEKAFSFMIRLRLPGGLVSPSQWLQLDDIATTYANGSLRLTTRATFQYHGVIKSNLRRTMQAINAACLDTIAALRRRQPQRHVRRQPVLLAGACCSGRVRA